MFGSANARWKVTVSIRIFEVSQVLTSRRAIDEEAGSDRDPIRPEGHQFNRLAPDVGVLALVVAELESATNSGMYLTKWSRRQ